MGLHSEKKILIAGNAPGENTNALDRISEVGVDAEMDAVRNACAELGYSSKTVHICAPLELLDVVRADPPDFIFNLCEGLSGDSAYEMNLAALLELIGIPFTGASSLLLGLARNKVLAKRVMRAAGVSVPEGFLLTRTDRRTPEDLSWPMICKPACEDASLGISKDSLVRSREELRRKTEELLKRYPQDGILVESYVDGREFNAAVLGDGETVLPLEISEIDFSALPPAADRVTTYEAKWLEDSPVYRATPARCPAEIDDVLRTRLQETACTVYRALNANAYGRVDLRLDREGRIYVLEYNPNPDITPGAGFANALAASGISYPEFVERMLAEALRKVRRK